MKRTILVLTLSICIISSGFSQQDDSLFKDKHGKIVLPQKGDMALGLCINPIFNYVGNLFNGSGNNQLALKLLNDDQLFFKYFLAPDRAIRTRVGISIYDQQYEDNTIGAIVKESHIELSAVLGYEKRKGRERLQIFYGGEAGFDFSTVNYKYDYLSSSYDLRITEARYNDGSGFMLRGFGGVEYFVLPKVSFGSEVGISVSQNLNKKIQRKSGDRPFSNFENNSIELNTDILNGQIYLLFHFE